MLTNSRVNAFLWPTWLESLVVKGFDWHVGKFHGRLGNLLSLGGHWAVLAIHVFGVIECSEFETLCLLREWFFLYLGIVILNFLFDKFFLVSVDIIFLVRNLTSKISESSNLSSFHGDSGEVSWSSHNATFLILIVLFSLILFQWHILIRLFV